MSKKLFRKLLTLSWVLGIASVAVDIATEAKLPEPLRLYIIEQEDILFSSGNIAVIVAALIVILLMIVSYIGLYFWRSWARHLFVIGFILGYLLTPLYSAPVVHSVWADDMYSITYIFSGIVIAGMYFCADVVNKFLESTNAQQ